MGKPRIVFVIGLGYTTHILLTLSQYQTLGSRTNLSYSSIYNFEHGPERVLMSRLGS